jgi:hypothetical protein
MARIFLLSLVLVAACVIQTQNTTAQELVFPQVEGWKCAQDETVYNPNNLFDAIDGAADLYLEYDFVDLHIARYTRGDLEIKAELYKLGSTVDAFGIFSQERYPDYHFIEIGVQGYAEKGALNFLSGIYYVKISTIEEGASAQEGMLLIAKAVEKHLHQVRTLPATIAFFPARNKKAYSEQFVAKNFLGYSPLNAAFVASYDDGSSFKAFFIKLSTPDDAFKTLTSFIKALPKNATRREIQGKQEIQDPNNGQIEVVLKSNYLLGVISAQAGKSHDLFLREFGMRLIPLK